MQLAMIGLGKMGANMARRLLRGGHRVVANDVDAQTIARLAGEGATPAKSLAEVVQLLVPPRAVWLMLPAGDITERAVNELSELLAADDVIVDGGNTFYKDDARRAELLAKRGIHYLDQGTSGGVWGLEFGYSLMIGGEDAVVERLRPAFETLAPTPPSPPSQGGDRGGVGWGHVGPVGAGHFVKMVHNGIEYGMMQALAEGFELLRAKADFELDLHQVGKIWQHGSVVRSWLLDLIVRALETDQNLPGIRDWVADSGEGRWTMQEAIDLDIPIPVIAASLWTRFQSRQPESYACKLLAALRDQFGGHGVKKD
jgi:6-phosphogluconate dehydrogenase